MMPIPTITQIIPPTQVSLVATPMPGSSVLRVPPTDVPPALPDVAVSPDREQAGGYAPARAANAAPPAPAVPNLSVLMPASLSTSSASLSASSMFAAQLLSQNDVGSVEYLSVYEQLVAVSQVKYKPSNASLPQPESTNLFAKMLAEEKSHSTLREALQLQQAPAKESPPPQAALQAMVPQIKAPAPKNRGNAQVGEGTLSALQLASKLYQGTTARNQLLLDDSPVEAIEG